MQLVRSRLGGNIHDPAGRHSILSTESGVEDTELAHRLLGRYRTRSLKKSVHVVRPVHCNRGRYFVKTGERDIDLIRLPGSHLIAQAAAPRMHIGSKEHKIQKLTPINRQILDPPLLDDLAQSRTCRLNYAGLQVDCYCLLCACDLQC